MSNLSYVGYFDGSLRLDVMYYGWIIFDDKGDVCEKFGAGVSEHKNTTNIAEYYGVRSLLRWFYTNNIREPVHIMGDSQLVIRQINEKYVSRAEHLNRLCHECRKLRPKNFELSWVPRAYNVADPCTRAIVMNPPEIKFWRTTEFYGSFSNFSRHPITVDGKFYATTEHYYQAMKCALPHEAECVRLANTPKEAKQIAYQSKMVDHWDSIKYNIMLDALRYKVAAHPDIKTLLLSTGNSVIIENSPYDNIWGCGKDGKGANLLGTAWMQIRDEIKSNER